MTPSPEYAHQSSVLATATHLKATVTGGMVVIAPMDVRLDDRTVVQPDVFWIAPHGLCNLVDGRWFAGPPDLIVEVCSPGTGRYDRKDKLTLYEQSGVREYWIADPHTRTVEVWVRLSGVGDYIHVGLFGHDDTCTSPLMGQPVPVRALFA